MRSPVRYSAVAKLPESLEDVLKRIGDVSTLPHIALKVMNVAQDPHSAVADLAAVVEGDAPLATKVLRTINSAAYAVREKVTGLEQAVAYLGFNEIRNLAVTLSVSKIFQVPRTVGAYDRRNLWQHLVSVGLAARLLAVRCRLPNFEDAFLAGLLHDVGIILEDQYVHEHFCRVMQALDESRTLIEVEQELLGFDHTRLAYRMAKRWRFPDFVQGAIRYHHGAPEYTGENSPIVLCVEVANYLCTAKGISSVGKKLIRPPREAVQALKLTKQHLQALVADLDEEFLNNQPLFELAT